jgi:uncharacterized protein (DUF2141 family)
VHRGIHASSCPRASHPRPSHLSAATTLMTAVTAAAATLFLSVPIFADELVVTINNIKEAGEIHVALYDNADAFEADRGEKGGAAPGITQGTIEFVEAGSVTYRYDVAPGTYAIGIFHDVNLNNRLDNYFFGVPKEQYGFSNDARGFMGPPSFKEAAFSVKGRTEIAITL